MKIKYLGASKVIKRIIERLEVTPELGEDHDDAYYGDFGKEAYDHSQIRSGNPHNVTAEDLGLGDIMNEVEFALDSLISTDNWVTHEEEYMVDHEGNFLVFISGANLLGWH